MTDPRSALPSEHRSGVILDVSPPRLIASADTRRAAGLDYWFDGTMGFWRRDGSTLVIAPNGPRIATHRLDGNRLVEGVVEPAERLQNLPTDIDHASGGPVYWDEEAELLLLVYHGESFHDGESEHFHSFIGMAVSSDTGRTFVDLGPVLTSSLSPSPSHGAVELGSGAFAVRGGWFLMWFQDHDTVGMASRLSLARAPLQDVLVAIREGRAPRLTKYTGSGFDQPGLGGTSIDLLPDWVHWPRWFDVAHVESLDSFVLVYSAVVDHDGERWLWNHLAVFSPDGIRWSHPQALYRDPEAAEIIYVTIDSAQGIQRSITQDHFELYRVRSGSAFRWDEGLVEQVTVNLRPLA